VAQTLDEDPLLDDAPPLVAPWRFSPDAQAQVTATACQLPRQQDVPSARGSRAKPAQRVVATYPDGLVSRDTVGGWLRAERLHPWRYRMWQHIYDPATLRTRASGARRLRQHRAGAGCLGGGA